MTPIPMRSRHIETPTSPRLRNAVESVFRCAPTSSTRSRIVPVWTAVFSTRPHVMDFDHVGEGKVLNIGRMRSSGHSLEEIEAEIAKCELVCANCHRERTQQRLRAA